MSNKLEIHPTRPYIAGNILDANENAGFALGHQSDTNMSVWDAGGNDVTPADAYTFPFNRITEVFATSTPGLAFLIYRSQITPTVLCDLYRTTTNGAGLTGSAAPGFTKVQQLGMKTDGSEQNAAMTIMQRGLCEAWIGGQRKFIYGEYNTNIVATRTTGDAGNDRVGIFISHDEGLTWVSLVKWYTKRAGLSAPAYQFDHIHAVRYNPYNGWIYICFGDAGTDGPCVIAWEPTVGVWADNLSLSELAARPGFKVLTDGLENQQYRYVDLLFTKNYCHAITDAGNNNVGIYDDVTGIVRMKHDLSEVVLIDACYTNVPDKCNHKAYGWTGVITPKGTIVLTEGVHGDKKTITSVTPGNPVRLTISSHGYKTGQTLHIENIGGTIQANGAWPVTVVDVNTVSLDGCNTSTAYTSGGVAYRTHSQLRVWTSTDEGATYKVVGFFGVNSDASGPNFLHTSIIGENIYLGSHNAAGKLFDMGAGTSASGTAIVQDTGIPFSDEFETIYNPVFFVDDSIGSNTFSFLATEGYSPDNPHKSLSYILTGRLPYGSRVIVKGANPFHSQDIQATITGNPCPCTGRIIIEGDGSDWIGTSTGSYSIQWGAQTNQNNMEVVLRNANFYDTGAAGTKTLMNIGAVGAAVAPKFTIRTRDMVIGNTFYNSGRLLRLYTNFEFQRTKFMPSAGQIVMSTESTLAGIRGEYYLMDGGTHQIYEGVECNTIELYNGLHVKYTASGIQCGTTHIPTIKNTSFYSETASAKSIRKSTALGDDDTYIDYNNYYGAGGMASPLVNGGTHSKTTNPLFADILGNNYHLQPTSPCIGAGVSIPAIHEQATPATDLDGNTIHFLPPSIGPYDGQGAIKTITSDYSPTGYVVREGANIVLGAHGLSVDFTGLTLNENNIKVKEAGTYRVHSFTRKVGTNQYVYGANSGGSGGGIFGSNFG